ncbi:hypothetical protein [Streptomyces sp. WM6372]|uniref:hypothetical protein n=1 Tax=Streptomyces sp. WM6372 TaxID=1415555 RepID=UPI00131AE59D|nr:hypothetical protein [Streptomyces sp. WM6372]
MTERRTLGTGPRPTTPLAAPTAARRGRLAAEPAEDSGTAGEEAAVPRSPGRRPLGPGADSVKG